MFRIVKHRQAEGDDNVEETDSSGEHAGGSVSYDGPDSVGAEWFITVTGVLYSLPGDGGSAP